MCIPNDHLDIDAVQDRLIDTHLEAESEDAERWRNDTRAADATDAAAEEAERYHDEERADEDEYAARGSERAQMEYEDRLAALANSPLLTGVLEDDIELLDGHNRRLNLRTDDTVWFCNYSGHTD